MRSEPQSLLALPARRTPLDIPLIPLALRGVSVGLLLQLRSGFGHYEHADIREYSISRNGRLTKRVAWAKPSLRVRLLHEGDQRASRDQVSF